MADLKPRRERILDMFPTLDTELSCDQVTKAIIEQELVDLPEHAREYYRTKRYKYTSGSISSVLKKLVDSGTLEYSERKTQRGGHIYKKLLVL